ncbi:MAG TPA: hypothetical protein VL383_13130 [Gemmatimonadaceae bacterium]|nr:hypothetical protein [Gemmatimonadaceae bacterium]
MFDRVDWSVIVQLLLVASASAVYVGGGHAPGDGTKPVILLPCQVSSVDADALLPSSKIQTLSPT